MYPIKDYAAAADNVWAALCYVAGKTDPLMLSAVIVIAVASIIMPARMSDRKERHERDQLIDALCGEIHEIRTSIQQGDLLLSNARLIVIRTYEVLKARTHRLGAYAPMTIKMFETLIEEIPHRNTNPDIDMHLKWFDGVCSDTLKALQRLKGQSLEEGRKAQFTKAAGGVQAGSAGTSGTVGVTPPQNPDSPEE